MKSIVRSGIFETSSSSIHTIVIKNPHLDPPVLPVKNGYTIAHFDKFDCWGGPYYDQATKLSYLASLIWYSCNNYIDDICEYYLWGLLEKAVCEVTGTKGIRVAKSPAEPYIDHQSVPSYEITFIDIYNIELVREFIFNSNIGLLLGRD